jgi:hypothetical protein
LESIALSTTTPVAAGSITDAVKFFDSFRTKDARKVSDGQIMTAMQLRFGAEQIVGNPLMVIKHGRVA